MKIESKTKRVKWDQNKLILLKTLINKGYSVESMANRMFTTQSSIRSAIQKHTMGMRLEKHSNNK